MRQISTTLLIFLALLIVFSSTTYAAGTKWPLKGEIDFSSGFGDFRPERFHAGLDLRTGGVIGLPVYAPVSGFVSRVKMSYYGYGKGLYFTGSDGRIYVFGHLSGFSPALDRTVKSIQIARKRYYIDAEFPKDSIFVQAGDLLGYSGQTGSGAPHLHFEARTGDNRPLNPFTHGFVTKDNIRPVFERVGFQLTDERSLLPNGERRMFLPVKSNKKGDSYSLDTVLCFNRPFGLLADCFDRVRAGGMKQAVYRLTVSVDDTVQYETVMDTLEFESGTSADLVYDYVQAAGGMTSVRRLFDLPGNHFPGVLRRNAVNGLIGLAPGFAIGRHIGRIRAEDASGNWSELKVPFLWGPHDALFTKDSLAKPNDSTTIFYFSPSKGYERLGVDSVVVYLNRGAEWGITPSAQVKRAEDGRLAVQVDGFRVPSSLLRLVAWTGDKGAIEDPPFNGWTDAAPRTGELRYEMLDDGLFVTGELHGNRGCDGRLEIYYKDSLLGSETQERYFSMQFFRWYVPALPRYSRIDRMEFVWTQDSVRKVLGAVDSLNIVRVSPDEPATLFRDTLLTVTLPKGAVYEPRFVELNRIRILNKTPLQLNSEHYRLLPETFVLKNPFGLVVRPFYAPQDSLRTALYRLDTVKNRWVWITDSIDASRKIYGTSRLGGSFATVYDLTPPMISNLNIKDLDIVTQTRPVISFRVMDSCAGFADDRNFSIKIDSKWQIPEFDPETGICQSQPLDSLAPGPHMLSIEVTDRVGNEAQQYLRFEVRIPPTKKGN